MSKELEPGPELNALVAQHVFDLERLTCHSGYCFYWIKIINGKEKEFKGLPPDYSTEIQAAWLGVERLIEMKLFIGVNWVPMSKKYTVEATTASNAYFYSAAKTAPHAICLAALKAVGYEG